MHLPGPLRRLRVHRQPRPSKRPPHSAFFLTHVSTSPGVQAGVQAGVSDCLSFRQGIYSSRPKDLRADSPIVKPLRRPPLQ